MLASHRPLAIVELKELDKVFVNLKGSYNYNRHVDSSSRPIEMHTFD